MIALAFVVHVVVGCWRCWFLAAALRAACYCNCGRARSASCELVVVGSKLLAASVVVVVVVVVALVVVCVGVGSQLPAASHNSLLLCV